MDDTTFSAYMRDPHFLKTILPITDHLDRILHRIFDCDPATRITIPELRALILQCPAFTLQYAASRASLAYTVPAYTPALEQYQLYPSDPLLACPSDAGSAYSDSCASAISSASTSSYVSDNQSYENLPANYVVPSQAATPQQAWYSNIMPAFDFAQKHMAFQPVFQGVRVF